MNQRHKEMQVTYINGNRIWKQVLKIAQDMDIIEFIKYKTIIIHHFGSNNYILKNNCFALKYE